jgi:cell shape-determining protein MreC
MIMIILIIAGVLMFAGEFNKYNNKQVGNNIQRMKSKQAKQAKAQEQTLEEMKKQNEMLRKLLEEKSK